MLNKGNIKLIHPKPYDEVWAKFVISGWIPLSWLKTHYGAINDRISLEFFDIDGKIFMGTSIRVYPTKSWISRIMRRRYFSEVVEFMQVNIGSLEKSKGRIVIKLSGQKERDQFIFLPLIMKQFDPKDGVDQETIRKHQSIDKMVTQYEEDLKNYYQGLEDIHKCFPHNSKEESEDSVSNLHMENLQVLWDVFGELQQSDSFDAESPYVKEEKLKAELAEKYKDALEWRGPLAGASIGRINGFEFVVYSNDHGKHFHVIHKGKGVDARFSFPEIELVNYKNKKNTISSKDKDIIKTYFQKPENMSRLENEFERRPQSE